MKLVLAAIVAALILGGCAGTAAPSSSQTATPTPTPTTASPSPTPTSTPSLEVATEEFCRTTFEHSNEGLNAIAKLVKHPDGKGLTDADFGKPRVKLVADEKLAPANLKKYLTKQIDVLGAIVAVLQGHGNDTIDTGGYRDAAVNFLEACAKQTEPTSTPTDEPGKFTPHKSDFKIGIKILKKQCFGSAGCSIEFRIKPSYVGSQTLPDSGEIEVSYRVYGDESGPIDNTFTIDSDGTAHYDKTESASTSSSSRKLTVKVTDVSYTP
jgi:hypothetical protein